MRLTNNSPTQGPRHLDTRLETALLKQKEQWTSPSFGRSSQDQCAEISPEQRDEVISWLVQLNDKFHFHPETLTLTTSIVDRFLQAVKARPKYLRCIGVASFYLAAKTLEEDELIPSTLELVRQSECGLSVSEVLRMERVVCDKLHWNLLTVTPLDFLHIFHAMLVTNRPHLLDGLRKPVTPSRQMTVLTDKLKWCLCQHSFLVHQPATLALAILSLELEQCTKEWFPSTIWLQSHAKISSQDLICCREQVARYLALVRCANLVYVMKPSSSQNGKATKRKVQQIEDDDIYDGIKRLYNEESDTAAQQTYATLPSVASSCSLEACQDATASPPLQAVAI